MASNKENEVAELKEDVEQCEVLERLSRRMNCRTHKHKLTMYVTLLCCVLMFEHVIKARFNCGIDTRGLLREWS